MPAFRIEVCTYERRYGLRLASGREVPVTEMVPAEFRSVTAEFPGFMEALTWCEEHSTPEREYRVAGEIAVPNGVPVDERTPPTFEV